ncbi:hypothetical protein [Aurantimonas sp. HBX-1]|uniref:hypothetical protein n=1 Tax=Aurantimonas sp. HBX-1 TaxID=2906072 RepID=UPI001F281ABA|nr:hypothetical protein [Aurantimonas sp. HBX-1]UIJ72733.1 hypothetical protein LXB15_03510 [Aurantimonas sp. HBX-1]
MSARNALFAALLAATTVSGCVETTGYYDDGYGLYDDGYRDRGYYDGYRGPVIVERVRPRRDYYRDRRYDDWREAERYRRERRDDREERWRDRPERVEERRAEPSPAQIEKPQPEQIVRLPDRRRGDRTLECDPASAKCQGIERLE